MANVGSIEYTVSVETQQSISAAQQFDKQMDQVQDSARKTDKELGKLDTGFSKLATAIKGVIAVSALRSMAGMVQQYQAMAERVEMATRSTEEFELVQRRLQTTADGTYRSLAEAQELYIRTADSIRDMGYSLEQAIDIQDSMSYAFVTNATSADRAQAAINQFTKAVNTGRVSADQWETISSAIPTIMNDIAAASGKSASEVRALGAAGKLTARELTEGLRQSLDDTRAAADNMATDLIDAAVRSRNALTTVLVGLENQTGAIQSVTDGIIAASEAMLEFGQDSEKMESFLNLATTAAASLAAVMAGRVIMSTAAGTKALYANTVAARAKAAADLQAAQSAAAAAAQNLIQAQATAQASVGLSTHAAAARTLAAAQAQATAATATLTAAQRTMAASFSLATAAANGLRTAMAFLGGPAGLILLVGAAFLTMGRNAKSAADDTELLTDNIKELTTAQRNYLSSQLAQAILDQEKAIESANEELERHARIAKMAGNAGAEIVTARQLAAIDSANQKIEQYNQQLQRLANMNVPAPSSGAPGGAPAESTTTAEGQKRLQAMRDEIELTRLTGVARARLTAIQRLGADATAEERAEAERLATELYNLEDAQDAAKKATEAAGKAAEEAAQKLLDAAKSDEEVIAALHEQLYQTTLTADELRKRQAELQLSKYATPEQYEEVRALAQALGEAEQKAADLERRRSAFGTDVAGAITGNTSPLSGGMFDDQTARYEAEAQAEQQRYADAMARLQEAKELELEVKGGYMALEEQMAQEHADRLAQIEKAKSDMMMTQAADAFGSMASNLQDYIQVFGSENKALMAMMKASAIAQTIIQTYQGAQQAFTAMSAIPVVGPALGVAAAAAAVAGGMARVASIRAQGARRQGGPVSPGSMYRVNEGGRPEVFQNNMGQQYMIPNERGKVVSNRDAQGGGSGVGVVINLIESPDSGRGGEMTSRTEDDQRIVDVIVASIRGQERVYDSISRTFGIREQGE